MPTYEYACSKCGHHFDQFQSMRDEPLKKCPKCKKQSLKRLIGGGAGLIFKGSGFYITDYKKSSGSAGSSEGGDSKPSSGEKKSDTSAAAAKPAESPSKSAESPAKPAEKKTPKT